MNLKKIEGKFIQKFCNDHNGEIRFLRGIFYDEKDGAEEIMDFITQQITELLMDMPLEEENKDNDIIRGGGELANYIRGSWMGFNTNIQEIRAWRDKQLEK